MVSPGIGPESRGADRVEFLNVRAGGGVQHECVRLRMESEGVVVNIGGGEGDGVGLSGRAPGGGGFYGDNRLKESLCRRGELGRHCSCVVGLSVFVGGEAFV
jgi:hypothetical protein